ncbi:MAG: DUF2937 family protein [Rhodospirillales bacterium]
MGALSRIADGLAATGGAAAVAQFPAFYQQYLQRLGGRLDQAMLAVGRLREAASDQGLSLAAYVLRFQEATDPVFRREGQNLLATLTEAQNLQDAHDALSNATPLERPQAFATHFDSDLALATFERYVPALPIDSEGLAYAAIGMLAGLLLLSGCQTCGRLVTRPFRRKHKRTLSSTEEP